MANISLNYDSLANVKRSLEEDVANDQLTQIKEDLTTAESTISKISSGHDNVWSNALKTISTQLTSLADSIESVLELATRTENVSDNFYESENKIKDDVNSMDSELADYFGLPENSGYTVTANTGAQTTGGAETTSPAARSGAQIAATTSMTKAVTGTILKSTPSKKEDKKLLKEDDKDKKKSPQIIYDKEENKENEINKTDDSTNKDGNKSDSTYQQAKENAKSISTSTVAKNVTASVAGTTTMGTAAGVAGAFGNPNKDTTTASESINNEETSVGNEKVTAEALGEFTEDPIEGTIEVENESGTHQTAPIDVNIDKSNGSQVIPTLAGVAAAGASGIGTKIVLDKRNSDEDDDEDEEETTETFSGDYETAGANENEQLDITDDIGFDPTEIIENDELGENNFSENIVEDSESSEEEGFNAMPALAGALAGAGTGMLLAEDDEEDESKE